MVNNTVTDTEHAVGLEQEAIAIPDNVFAITSHGEWQPPDFADIARRYYEHTGVNLEIGQLSEYFSNPEDERWAKDGSDFAVGAIGRYIGSLNPDAYTNPPKAGRMFINPNASRKRNSKQPIHEHTFSPDKVPVYDEPPSEEMLEQMAKEIWDTFMVGRVQPGIETVALETDPNDHVLFVDIHDTDVVVYNREGELVEEPLDDEGNIFPLLLLSDRDGKAAHPYVREVLGIELLTNLVAEGLITPEEAEAEGVSQNFIYKGGYTTERFGIDLPNAYQLRGNRDVRTKAQHMHFIQVELNRTMYITEDRTGYDEEKMERTQRAVAKALANTANAIRHLELGDWRDAPAKGTTEYEAAMGMELLAASPHWYNRATPVIHKKSK